MITKIPDGQICQSFDPKMNLHPDVLKMHGVTQNANTSCLVQAFVYVEGKHGKKFLCDYHYYYELYMNRQGYSAPNGSWEEIQQFIIDDTEKVKETFAKNVTTTETVGHKCSLINSFNKSHGCTADAFVKVNPIKLVPGKINFTAFKDRSDITKDIFYCNFHFRRESNRYHNNGVRYEDYHKVLDERYRMTFTLAEEAKNLTYV
jgi:hypothetical protein